MKLVVQKYNPAIDAEPYYVEGDVVVEVENRDKITALDALYVFHNTVCSVNFDFSCGGRICGRCAVMVDGKPGLLCTTIIDDSEHTIEPLAGFPVIVDLVVEKSSFERDMTQIARRVMLEPISKETVIPKDYEYSPENQELMYFSELCCRCGMCMTSCPVLKTNPETYVGPAEMFQVGFRHLDYYDDADRIAQAVSCGLYHCTQCGTCDTVCAREIDHQSMWKLLREAAESKGIVPSYAK